MIRGQILYAKESGSQVLFDEVRDDVIYAHVKSNSVEYPVQSLASILGKGYWQEVYTEYRVPEPFEKHETHDQSSHGSWASGGGGIDSIASEVLSRAEQGKKIDLGSYPEDRDDVISKYAYDKEKLGEVIHRQNWDKPSIGLPSNEFEKLAENLDFVRVYRGAPKRALTGLLNGEPWIGNGAAGPGTYISVHRERAELFARGVAMPDRGYVVHEFLVPKKMLDSAQTREEVNNFIVSRHGAKSRFDSDAPQVLSAANGYGAHNATSHTGHSGDYVIYNTSALIVKLNK
jgi:hypothetical protein